MTNFELTWSAIRAIPQQNDTDRTNSSLGEHTCANKTEFSRSALALFRQFKTLERSK